MKIVIHTLFVVALCLATTARAVVFTNLYTFSLGTFDNPVVAGANGGSTPDGALLSLGGILYGTTMMGGSNNLGAVFASGGSTVIHTFSGPDGAMPQSDLVAFSNILFGTTVAGGAYGGGTLFAVNTDGTGFTNLFSFAFTNGANPQAGLVMSGNTLYGTTSEGGTFGAGTLFAIGTNGTGFTNLYNFHYTNGANPQGDLLLLGNTLYGTTADGGGSNGWGTVFSINTDGTAFTNLFTFTYANGANPLAGLALVSNVLCGTTTSGGSFQFGTLFLISTNGTGFSLLHSFGSDNDGILPYSRLTVSYNGDSSYSLYGTTELGGTASGGIVFQLNLGGPGLAFSSYTIINNLQTTGNLNTPLAGLILTNGVLYGTASSDDQSGAGGVFSINMLGGYGYNQTHEFTRAVPDFNDTNLNTNRDGATPFAGLVLSGNTLYGTTSAGGVTGNGTIFALNTDGTAFNNLCSLSSTDAGPWAGLILSGNMLYGLSTALRSFGNKAYYGSSPPQLFALNMSGAGFTNFFSLNEGDSPVGNLFLTNGIFYGTTEFGGTNGAGAIFAVTTNGTNGNTLYNFNFSTSYFPNAGLVLSGNTLYGAALNSGDSSYGAIYAVNTDGTGFTNILTFNGTNGSTPQGTLVLLGNRLFGVTASDAMQGFGTIFAVNTDGTGFTNLYIFNGYDGENPLAGLILCNNTLYGTTSAGGAGGFGTLFAINTDGTDFTNLYNFTGGYDGATPYDSLVLSGNTLYGTTSAGGVGGNGTVFALSLGPIPLCVQPDGDSVILRWGNPAFSLQAAPAINGPYTNVSGASSPYTTAIAGSQEFFRLQSP